MPTDPALPAEQASRLRRYYGRENPGTVWLRDFDEGLVTTLGAFVHEGRYWLSVEGVDAPPDRPGVPVTWSFSEAEYKAYVVPLLVIRRDDVAAAMERWHSHHQTFRAPAATASPYVVDGRRGYDRMETGYQALPYDITYTLSVLAHYRGAPGQRGQAQAVLQHVLRTYPPYGELILTDSLGDPRTYNTFTEGISTLDEHPEIAERVIGFGVTVRVEAELDLHAPEESRTVTQKPSLTLSQRKL